MTLLDWIIVAVLAFSTLAGLFSGLLRGLSSFLGLFAGLLLAAWNYKVVAGRFIHFVADKRLAKVVAFLLIAIGIMLLAALIGALLRKSAKMVGLGWVDSLFGGVFGFLRGCLLIAAGMMAVAAFLPSTPWLEDSRLAPYFMDAAHQMADLAPSDLRKRIGAGARKIKQGAHTLIR